MSVYCSVYWFREFSVNSKQYFLIDNSLKFSLPVHLAMHKIVWRFHLLTSHVTEGFIHQTECFVLEPKFFFICFHIKITQFVTCFISVRELSSVEDQSTSKWIQFCCCCCFSYRACIKLHLLLFWNFEYSILQLPACLPTLWMEVRLRLTLLWYKHYCFSNLNCFVIMLTRY